MDFGYGIEKLGRTIDILTVDPAVLSKRLASAYVDQMMHITPEKDLPESLRSEFKDISEEISNHLVHLGPNSVEVQIEDNELVSLAHKILNIYSKLIAR